mgnify:CR=1 FL=1
MSGCDPPESQYTLFYKSEETNLSAFTDYIYGCGFILHSLYLVFRQ